MRLPGTFRGLPRGFVIAKPSHPLSGGNKHTTFRESLRLLHTHDLVDSLSPQRAIIRNEPMATRRHFQDARQTLLAGARKRWNPLRVFVYSPAAPMAFGSMCFSCIAAKQSPALMSQPPYWAAKGELLLDSIWYIKVPAWKNYSPNSTFILSSSNPTITPTRWDLLISSAGINACCAR